MATKNTIHCWKTNAILYMYVAQTLIKEQYPYINGLMPTILQGRNPLPKHSLQILHTDGDHWVAVSTFNTGDHDIIMDMLGFMAVRPSV